MLVRGKERLRLFVQTAFTLLTNGYYRGFLEGSIYKGELKKFCVPGLSCYSCPGALGSCPVGAFQSVINDRNYSFSFYIAGFLTAVGALMGRFVCGWLCPFGLFQDLLHKIPIGRKRRTVKGDCYLRYLRYVVLAVFVLLLPLFLVNSFGQGDPWFCKYLCPAGTLQAGWIFAVLDKGIRDALGFLFAWKSLLLIGVIIVSILIYRPFCRYLCPLGAIYGLFNPIALYRYEVEEDSCTGCGRCQRACRLDIAAFRKPNSPDCIRCGRCIADCPQQAIKRKKLR